MLLKLLVVAIRNMRRQLRRSALTALSLAVPTRLASQHRNPSADDGVANHSRHFLSGAFRL